MIWKIWQCPDMECEWEATDGHLKHGIEAVTVTPEGLLCPLCGCPLRFYMHSSQRHIGIASQEERVSLAMGVTPSNIEAAMKKYPGSRYRPDGALLYLGRSGQKAALKARGYVNYN